MNLKEFFKKRDLFNSEKFKDQIKYKNILLLVNKINPLRLGYPHYCYYCKKNYIVKNINNIYCSNDCATMYNNFIDNEMKFELLTYHKKLLNNKK